MTAMMAIIFFFNSYILLFFTSNIKCVAKISMKATPARNGIVMKPPILIYSVLHGTIPQELPVSCKAGTFWII